MRIFHATKAKLNQVEVRQELHPMERRAVASVCMALVNLRRASSDSLWAAPLRPGARRSADVSRKNKKATGRLIAVHQARLFSVIFTSASSTFHQK
jgi:hypothetical protein